jgi:hypothetical protein
MSQLPVILDRIQSNLLYNILLKFLAILNLKRNYRYLVERLNKELFLAFVPVELLDTSNIALKLH